MISAAYRSTLEQVFDTPAPAVTGPGRDQPGAEVGMTHPSPTGRALLRSCWPYLSDETPTRRDPAIQRMVEHIEAKYGSLRAVADALMELGRMYDYGVELTPEIIERVIDSRPRTPVVSLDGETILLPRVRVRPDPEPAPAVVYYMRTGNRVKIGTSRSLRQRLQAIMPEELMVTEPGDYSLEKRRHRQFADLHTHGEWFRLEAPLTDHIAALRRARRRA